MDLRCYTILLICCILFILTTDTPTIHAQQNDLTFINSIEEDITGDGLREYIKLQGKLLSNKSNYFRSIWVDIKGPFSQEWKISLGAGYQPDLQLIDFTHDQVNELFFKVTREESASKYTYQLYNLKDSVIKKIPLPEKTYIQGYFTDDFKIEIRLAPNDSEIIVKDLPKNNLFYIQKDIYNQEGKLLINKPITTEPISRMEPILISNSKGYGLKSYQQVYGTDSNDQIGTLESIWYYQKGKWIVLKNQFT